MSAAVLLQKIYEVDPLVCPKCGSRMKVIAVITEHSSLKKILKHVGLWNETIEARGPPFHSISNKTEAGRISNEMLLAYATEEDIEYIPFNDGWPEPEY